MKKLLLFSMLSMAAIACNNNVKTEDQEARERDSMDNLQKAKDEEIVKALEAADSSSAHEHDHAHDHGDSGHHHSH